MNTQRRLDLDAQSSLFSTEGQDQLDELCEQATQLDIIAIRDLLK